MRSAIPGGSRSPRSQTQRGERRARGALQRFEPRSDLRRETLNEGRIGIGAQMVGVAQGSFEHGLRYAQERRQFGRPIAEFQAVQFLLAELATELEASRLLTYNAARLRDTGAPFIKEAAMAKLFASRAAEHVSSKVIEIHGGYGFSREYPVEKYFRDQKVGQIYEGTTHMQLMVIAKQLLGKL
ncbi:MAG: hypothetical protein DMF82_25055 [Acidobacteria bacterium]|nr:MAG: hypothetical protein DMF82_25055 [Acidobacteriota bacterium]